MNNDKNYKEEIYLTEREIEDIEQLNSENILDFIKNMSDNKKQLVMKLFEKEMVLQQWRTVIKESYK